MANKEAIVGQIDKVLWNIAFYPLNGTQPEQIGWEEYIARYPEYSKYEYGLARAISDGARPELESLPEHKRKLAGAIMRACLTDKEIEGYGREEVRTR